MNLSKFLVPTIAFCVVGSTAFDAFFAEGFFHDRDIKISPGFDKTRAKGRTHNATCNSNPFERGGIPPDHRLTLTDPVDLQFTVKADYEDPVIFIFSKQGFYCIQQYSHNQEDFNSTKIWLADMPAGTYLIWIGDFKGRTNNYNLIIEED